MTKQKILIFSLLLIFLTAPILVLADNGGTPREAPTSTGFIAACRKDPATQDVSLSRCIQGIYLLSLGLGAVLAVLMIVLAGYRYMTAGGNAQQVEGAKEGFAAAFIGLIIIFVAFILLNVINPDLTQFKEINQDLRFPLSVDLIAKPGTVDPGSNSNIELKWVSLNAVSCTGVGRTKAGGINMPFDTGQKTDGAVIVGPVTETTEYTITCSDAGAGQVTDSATITVGGAAVSSVRITVTPNPADRDESISVSWVAQGASGKNITECRFELRGPAPSRVVIDSGDADGDSGRFEIPAGALRPGDYVFFVFCLQPGGTSIANETTFTVNQ